MTATKRTETRVFDLQHHCTYSPSSLCCVNALSGLRMQMHCFEGQRLVSVLYVAVLITLFSFENFFITWT